MNADAAALDTLGKLLIERAGDLSWIGRQLVNEAFKANWECAKADRYTAAMEARSAETKRLSLLMRDLGKYLRARAAQLDAAASAPQQGGTP